MTTLEKLQILISQTSGNVCVSLVELKNHGYSHPVHYSTIAKRNISEVRSVTALLSAFGISYYIYNESSRLVENGKIIVLAESLPNWDNEEKIETWKRLAEQPKSVLYAGKIIEGEDSNDFSIRISSDGYIRVQRFAAPDADFRTAYLQNIQNRSRAVFTQKIAVAGLKSFDEEWPNISVTPEKVFSFDLKDKDLSGYPVALAYTQYL